MANTITSDNISTPSRVKSQTFDTQGGKSQAADGTPAAPADSDSVAVNRAQQRAVQTAHETATNPIETAEQAQAIAQRLAASIGSDPAAALQAHGGVGTTLFEAATARPTA